MKKIISVFLIICGLGIGTFWIISLSSGSIPEVKTELVSIILHVIAEYLLAIFLLMSGLFLLLNKKWVKILIYFAIGMLLCSVINAG